MASDSSDIEVRALRIFESDLPDECIVNVEAQDKQHLDCTFHLRESSRPSGFQCGAQVKGSSRSKGSRRRVSKRFKREHLEYWIERSRLPVFIVICDVAVQKAYYISAREWARSAGSKWKQQRTTTVHIPRTNQVANHGRFIEAIRAADLEQQRSAGRHAIDAYEQLDGRFTYGITNTASGEHVTTIQAREPVDVQISVAGEQGVAKFREMFRTGRPQEFQPGELRFDGGPLFDHLQAEAAGQPVHFQASAERDCHVAILTEAEDGAVRAVALEGLGGKAQVGTEQMHFAAELRDAPLRVQGFLEQRVASGEVSGELRLTLDYPSWVGHRLRDLPGLGRVESLVAALAGAERAFVRFTLDGVHAEPPTPLDREIVTGLANGLEGGTRIHVALRQAAETLGVNPRLPDLTSYREAALEQLCAMLDLCATGELSAPINPIELDHVYRTRAETADVPDSELRNGRFRITEHYPASLLGETSEAYVLARHIGPFSIAEGSSIERVGGQVRMRLKSVQDARVLYRLIPTKTASDSGTLLLR